MKPLLPVLCLLHLFFLSRAQSRVQTIVVTFNQAPASATSRFAAAKYNKDAVFQMEFDDRVGQFNDVFAYMNGGRASDGITYPGQTYTDGCGNKVNFRAGVACNAYPNLATSDWEYYGNYVTWTQIWNYLVHGWIPENHGLRHTTTDQDWPGYYNNVALMHRYIADSTNGFSCRVWVSPNNDDGYLSSVQALGYLASTAQGARDGYPAYPPADWNHYTSIEALPDGFVQFTRNLNWDWTPSSVTTNLNPLIDGLVSGNTSTNHKLMRLFSHAEVWDLQGFKQFADYLQTKANDKVWICTLQEFMEYQEAKRRVLKREALSGSQLTITLDWAQVPDSAHFQDLSLLLDAPGVSITNVSVSGADRSSFNAATGLVNVFKLRKYGTQSSVAITAPPAVSAFNDAGKCGAGNVVLGTAVTTGPVQSVSNNAPAFFPVGTTMVTWTATGTGGSSATAVQTVTVTDNEKPQVTCPAVANLCYNSTNTYTIAEATATDNCGLQSSSFSITGATTRSGSGTNASGIFNPGSSTITWTITDVHGNSNACQTTVVIGNTLNLTIPDALAGNKGTDVNTVYMGYAPASSIKLTAKPSGGSGTYTYLWSTGGTGSSITVSPTSTTTYTVTVKDGTGCTNTAGKTINVVDVRCGPKNDMVLVCTGGTTQCIKSNTVVSKLNSGAYLGTCKTSNTSTTRSGQVTESSLAQPDLVIVPNPTHSFFTITLDKASAPPGATLIVRNASGRLIERQGLGNHQTVQFGGAYQPGVYIAELILGEKRNVQKLVKLGE